MTAGHGARLTRREWHGLVVGGLVAAPLARLGARQKPDSRIAGVRIGAQTYSFRSMALADIPAAMASIGLSYCELWQGHVETREAIAAPTLPETTTRAERSSAQRDALRAWRLAVPLDHFRRIRAAFDDAGVTLTAYNLTFQADCTDGEIDRGFDMARALGVDVITLSSRVEMAARLDSFAARHRMTVAHHNHATAREAGGGVITLDDFARVLSGASEWTTINLDIGHLSAAGFDALAFLDANHARIVSVHIKDKLRDGNRNVPWGEGDAPIVEVLRRLRDRRWDIPAQIEYEYRGADATTEVARCFEYCRKALL